MKCKSALMFSFLCVMYSLPVAGQENAIPEEVLKDMRYYVGDWTTRVESDGQVTDGKWSAKWSAGGTCLVVNISGEAIGEDGKITETESHATGVIGWEASRKTLEEANFWSDGDSYNANYQKKSPTYWEGDATGVVDGKAFTEKVSITRKGPNEFVWKAFDYVLGGEKQPDIVVTMRKVMNNQEGANHDKLDEAMGWLIGDWEVSGDEGDYGPWAMKFSFGWGVRDTVVDLSVDWKSEELGWGLETRYYWDATEEEIQYLTVGGANGAAWITQKGILKDHADNVAIFETLGGEKPGMIRMRYELKPDGALLFKHFSLLDDGTMRENWEFVLTKK